MKIKLSLLLGSAMAFFAISSCGGGGGGGGNPGGGGVGVLTYSASFNPGTAGGPVGLSEVVTVKTSSGTTLGTQTVNAPSNRTATVQANFTSLPNATLFVHATLYSLAGGQGSAAGSIDATINGNTASVVQAALAQPISQVVVSPATASVVKGASQQFVAGAEDVNGEFVFQSSLPVWTVSPASGVATVSATGLAQGVGGGQATIQAAIGSVQGSATLTITALSQGTWTVMVFLNSANDLDTYSYPNVQQIESIAQTASSPTRFVIQWKLTNDTGSDPESHPFNGTRRYLAVQNGLQLIQDMGSNPVVDMGSPTTLQQFISWTVQNYPATHYALVLWDHGNGWREFAVPTKPKFRGISYDYQTGNHIDVWQLAGAIGSNHLDILSFDACLMQMLEVENEVRNSANYMVCGEDNTPAPGYPYNTAFAQFVSNPNEDESDLAKSMVDAFMNNYESNPTYKTTPLSHSVVNLQMVSPVVTALGSLSSALIAAGSGTGAAAIGADTNTVRNASLCYDTVDQYYYYDLDAIAGRYAAVSSVPAAVTIAGKAVAAAVNAAVVYSRNNSLSRDSHGMAIEFGTAPEYSVYASQYQNLQLSKETSWPTFLSSATLNP